MTVTNEERREVAENLRGMCSRECRYAEQFYELLNETVMREWDFHSFQDVADRLADLIDPDTDLTCELEPTASERTSAPVRVYECDCCGRSCDSVYAEDYVYCPYCGRLNTAREVEVGE